MDHLASAHLNSQDAPANSEFSANSFMSDFAEATHDLLMAEAPVRRAEAALRLASLGKPLASPYLIAALADSAWEVRQAAAESLGRIGDEEAIAPLQDLLGNGNQDSSLQQAITQAISSITSRTAARMTVAARREEAVTANRDDEASRMAVMEANRNRI